MPNDQTAHPSQAPAPDKPKRQRMFRGKLCNVAKTVRNVNTGVIYDLVEYTRQVTNRRDGSVTTETLTRKMRRPGTGTSAREVEIETEIEGATAT